MTNPPKPRGSPSWTVLLITGLLSTVSTPLYGQMSQPPADRRSHLDPLGLSLPTSGPHVTEIDDIHSDMEMGSPFRHPVILPPNDPPDRDADTTTVSLSVGYIRSIMKWKLAVAGQVEGYELEGQGFSATVGYRLGKWEFEGGADVVYMSENTTFAGENIFLSGHLGIRQLFFPTSLISPYVGARGQFHDLGLEFRGSNRFDRGFDLRMDGLGVDVYAGLALKLSAEVKVMGDWLFSWNRPGKVLHFEDNPQYAPGRQIGEVTDWRNQRVAVHISWLERITQ